jgi:chromosome segregation ATPase
MGVSMMGPDWTHWNGAVDTLLDKLNTMEEWINEARATKLQESKLDEIQSQLEDTDTKLSESAARLASTESQLEALDSDSQSQSNKLLLPSVIIGVSMIVAAVLIMQRKSA